MSRTLAIRGMIAAAALATPLLAVAPAQSAPVPVAPSGTVTAASGVNERAYPSTDSKVTGRPLKHRAPIGLRCKVRAQNIGGNEYWYLLRARPTWVAAKYVGAVGSVPLCRSVNRSALDDTPATRAAMG
ncbi:SH3 domain-containing protein [Streptomyces syringium]|uniref:SH3 domain-containing protein n=1 Tax=Streptomyces syringium TaxID=76729 RepID=UPI00343C1948